jgi:hypothetical protein
MTIPATCSIRLVLQSAYALFAPEAPESSPLGVSNGGERKGGNPAGLHAGGPSLVHKLWGINEILGTRIVMTESECRGYERLKAWHVCLLEQKFNTSVDTQ